MKWFVWMGLACAALASPCYAQNNRAADPRDTREPKAPYTVKEAPRSVAPAKPNYSIGVSPGELTPTPDMWYYEQARRDYLDPKLSIRRKAEFETSERLRRQAVMRWYGYSPQRPPATPDPVHAGPTPPGTWGGSQYPVRWAAYTATVITPPPSSGHRD